MGLKTKLAAGAAVVALAPLAGAMPAGADYEKIDEEQAEVSLLYNGEKLTCTIQGQTAYTFQDSDDTATIRVSTSVFGDPGCAEAVNNVTFQGSYEPAQPPGSGRNRTFIGIGYGPYVTSSFIVPGPTGSIRVAHFAGFDCDDQASCDVRRDVITSPK